MVVWVCVENRVVKKRSWGKKKKVWKDEKLVEVAHAREGDRGEEVGQGTCC